jgi:hypothetical protein
MNDAAQSSVIRRLLKWLVLVAFIAVALFYLNGAIYSARLSEGLQSPYPSGWLRQAAGQLCYAFASLSFGLGLFKGIQTFPRATSGSAALIVLAALLVLGPYAGRFILFDKCLDQGGSWNRETIQCSEE